MKNPKVSIVCISYNQQEYISQAVEGFLSQKTNFPIEIIIADDASTDATADIIRKYEKQNPDLFFNLLRTKNVGIKNNLIEALKLARGEYIALCEGDDFWTNPLKIQKQADFLDTHKNYGLVFHPVRVFFENQQEQDTIFPAITDKRHFTRRNLLKKNFIQTNSVMYRRVNYEDLSLEVMPLDWYLHLVHARSGRIGFINEVMSAYRRHSNGVWWETTHQKRDEIWKKHGAEHIVLYTELLKMYGDEYENRRIIDEHIEGTINIFTRIDNVEKTNLIGDFIKKFPKLNSVLILSLSRSLYIGNKVKESNENTEMQLKKISYTLQNLQKEMEKVLTSKTYKIAKILSKASHITRRIK